MTNDNALSGEAHDDPQLQAVLVCELCVAGKGGECHVPGCAFWMNDAPTSPLQGASEAVVTAPFDPHAARSRWFGGPPLADVTPRERALLDEVERAIALVTELEAECERHRKARLVRAVVDGWGDRDEWISEVIAKPAWDAVPWMVAEKMRDENARLRAAAEGARLAAERGLAGEGA